MTVYHAGPFPKAPLLGLVHGWALKLPLSFVGAVSLDAALRASDMWSQLFDGDEILMAACLVLLLLDTATGIMAALRRGERVRSRIFRQAGLKAIEYTAIGCCAVVISNAFHHTLFQVITDSVDEAALFYVAATEAFSVAENVLGSKARAEAMLSRILRILSFMTSRALGRVEASAGMASGAAAAAVPDVVTAADVERLDAVVAEISRVSADTPPTPTAGEEPAAPSDGCNPTR